MEIDRVKPCHTHSGCKSGGVARSGVSRLSTSGWNGNALPASLHAGAPLPRDLPPPKYFHFSVVPSVLLAQQHSNWSVSAAPALTI